MTKRRARSSVEYEPTYDTSEAEALLAAALVALSHIDAAGDPTVDGVLVAFAAANIRVAREALEIRRSLRDARARVLGKDNP